MIPKPSVSPDTTLCQRSAGLPARSCKPHAIAHYLTLLTLCIFFTADLHALMRERVSLDRDWQFQSESDSSPRNVHLPHDWSIEQTTHPDASSAGGGGFFPTGSAWYRKQFEIPAHWTGKHVAIEFEGVYRNAEVWINDTRLGSHANGYTPFTFDLTPHLRPGETHTLAVHVVNEPQPNSRWYTGSGIYRPVWLHVFHPVHIPLNGVEISTWDLYPEAATMWVQTEILNSATSTQTVRVETTFIDPDGFPQQSVNVEAELAPGQLLQTSRKIPVTQPRTWSPDSPDLYRAITRVFVGDLMTDRVDNTFGIRDARVSPTRGFELNRETQILLFGGNVHHDNGPLGAASHARAEERKVRLLKEAGFNAVRTAHNPPSTAFLEACDRLGMMVINEFFDGWASAKTTHDYSKIFHDNWQSDLESILRRDRNHPSVVMWSIGNEMYERGSPRAVDIATAMTRQIRTHIPAHPNNPIRLVTAGVNGVGEKGDWSRLDPLFATLDVAGYNYELTRHSEDHTRIPNRVIYSSESYQKDAFATWSAAHDYPYVIGDFVWSAIDYLGEAGIGRVFPPDEEPFPHWEGNHYPWHGATCGDIDITGHRKPISHYRNIVWNRGEKLYAAVAVPTDDGRPWNPSQWAIPPMQSHWTWPGFENKELQVEVYSRYDSVKLYLNNKLLSEKPTTRTEQFKAVFSVPYRPGTLKVVGILDRKETESFELKTAGPAHSIALHPEQQKILPDGHDLAYIVAEIHDNTGQRIFASDHIIEYEISGPAEIIAVGNADLSSREPYTATTRKVHQGRALIIIRSKPAAGTITLTSRNPDLGTHSIQLTAGY